MGRRFLVDKCSRSPIAALLRRVLGPLRRKRLPDKAQPCRDQGLRYALRMGEHS